MCVSGDPTDPNFAPTLKVFIASEDKIPSNESYILLRLAVLWPKEHKNYA